MDSFRTNRRVDGRQSTWPHLVRETVSSGLAGGWGKPKRDYGNGRALTLDPSNSEQAAPYARPGPDQCILHGEEH